MEEVKRVQKYRKSIGKVDGEMKMKIKKVTHESREKKKENWLGDESAANVEIGLRLKLRFGPFGRLGPELGIGIGCGLRLEFGRIGFGIGIEL
jgi:hypothetical protein